MTAPGEKMVDAKDRIIVALDVDSETKALDLINELSGSVGAFKIGLQLFTQAGPTFVRKVVADGNRVFLDLKFHDIPNTVARAGIEAARLGVWMFNVHAMGGREMMRRTAAEVSEVSERENLSRPKIIAVTILTSSGANDLGEIGIEQAVNTQVQRLANLAATSGLDGVVSSAYEAAAIKGDNSDFLVVTPGIRPASGTNDDQRRVMTPAAAVQNGTDHLVIGRPITGATDRRNAVDAILKEVESALREIS